MQLPVKIIPRLSQQIGFIAGSLITLVMSVVLVGNILPEQLKAGHLSGMGWFVIALAAGMFLFSLGGLTVGLINLFGGSPFQHLIVDQQGVTRQTFLGARRFSWKDLGPFRSYRTGFFQMRGNELRYWIVADTHGATEGGATGLWPLSGNASLRFPAATYVSSGWLVGAMGLAANDAAGWLEELRQLARMDRLMPDDVPDPPDCFRPPRAITAATPEPTAPRSTEFAGRSLKSRHKPVIER